ncbi:MAG: DoxX family protein [Dehalococcoidia bacterium]|nr:DoxX family protein [Dehalococcoidia bacterium]
MAQAIVSQQVGELAKRVATEEIEVRAPAEGVWPAKVVQSALPAAVLLLRLTMGWVFVWAGFDKLIRGFDASGFLVNTTKGPLSGWFQSLGENQAALDVINPMVTWGQILIGVALIFGVAVRWSAFWGAAMMFLFYIAQFPPEHNPFMEYYLIYMLLLGLLGALGAGRIAGLDTVIERQPWVRRIPGATFFLG